MFRQRTKLAHRVAAPAGTNASPSAAATAASYPTAPTPPTFYNPNAVGAPPAPSPGLASIPQQGWQQSPQPQNQQWGASQPQQYPQQQQQQSASNNNAGQQEYWNWEQQQNQWEQPDQQQQWNQMQQYQGYDGQNNFNSHFNYQQVEHQPYQQQPQQGYQQQSPQQAQHQPQPGYQQQQPTTPIQPQQPQQQPSPHQQLQPSPHQQQQLPPQQPQQQQPHQQQPNDSWGWEWNQTNQDASWNWDDSEAAEATLNASKVEQLGQQMADVNLNQNAVEPVEKKESAPPTPKQPAKQQQQPQTPVHQEPPPPMHSQQRRPQQNMYQLDEHEIRHSEHQGAEIYDVVENVEVPLAYAEDQVRPNHESENLEVEPDNVEAPADEVVRLPAVSPLPPPPPVTSRVAVGQDDPSPWPSVIPPPENQEQQRPRPAHSTSPPLPPPPGAANDTVDPVSASDRNQFLETGQLSAELNKRRSVPGESRQSPVPGGPRVVPGTMEPDEPNGLRSETIGSEGDEAPTPRRTTGEGVVQPPPPPMATAPAMTAEPRTSAEGDNEAPPRMVPKKQMMPHPPRPTEDRTNAEGTNDESESGARRVPVPNVPRTVMVGDSGSAFNEDDRKGAEGEADPEGSDLEDGEISDLEIISGGEFDQEEQGAEEESSADKRKESRQTSPVLSVSPHVDKQEKRRRRERRVSDDRRSSDKKSDKVRGKPPRSSKDEPKKRYDREKESQPRSRRRRDYDDKEDKEDSDSHSDRGRRYRGERSPDRKYNSLRSARGHDIKDRDKDRVRTDRDGNRDRDRVRDRDRDRERDDYRHHRDYRYEDDRYSNRERSRPSSRAGSEARRNDYESDHLDRTRTRSSRDKAYYDYRDRYRRDHRDPYSRGGYYDYYNRPYEQHPFSRGPQSLTHFPEYTPQTAAYFEELRRTNPAAYADWYRRYLTMAPSSQPGPGSGTLDGFNDDNSRGSVHSGRSSINDEIRFLRARSPAHSLRDLPLSPLYLRQGPPSLPPTIHSYHPQHILLNSAPSQTGVSAENLADRQPSPVPIQRLTPAKFSSAHPVARVSGQGRLAHVLPHYPRDGQVATVLIHDLQVLLSHDPIHAELRAFPGPLVRGTTHKNSVIQFCSQKIKHANELYSDTLDKESYILVWQLLILLLRQNGTVVGADIAELLMSDSKMANVSPISSRSGTPEMSEDEDRARPARKQLSEEQLTAKFRQFLLFGNTKEALDWAMKHGLWGHALFLASKMDARTYANVMTRFANGLSLNDPLQTLYQLMSGRQPAAVTSCADEKWGDWKPHLAMILSNPSSRPDLDYKAITTLGDTLAGRGYLHASQFCYLLAQIEFGQYGQHPAPKLCLLGSAASLPLDQFGVCEAVQCTEVYEYARRLSDPNFYIPSLQPFKLLYAGKLVDYGYPAEALLYCEELANTLVTHNSHGDVAAQVAEMADKLKQSDPLFSPTQQGEEPAFFASDPQWLILLRQLVSSNAELSLGDSYGQQASAEQQFSNEAQWTQYYADHNSHWEQQPQTQQTHQPQSDSAEAAAAPTPDSAAQANYWQQQQQTQWAAPVTTHDESPTTPAEPALQQSAPPTPSQMFTPQYAEPVSSVSSTPQPSYNYWDNHQTEQSETVGENTPDSDSPPSISLASSRARQKTISESSSGSNKHGGGAKSTPKGASRNQQQGQLNAGQEGSGWFGGLLSKISLRPKNQMKLPDDKNPTIVWDDDRKKWVNKDDGDVADGGGDLAPPPKMAPRMQPMQVSSAASSPSPAASPAPNAAPPPSASSGYKLGRNMRKNYVNVLQQNGSAASSPSAAPTDLFPTMGMAHSAPPVNLFVPAPVDGGMSASDYMTPASSAQVSPSSDSENSGNQQAGPVMYNPNQFGVPQYQ